MDAYGLGVAATLNASTKMDFQSKNLMMRIDHVDQDSPVQTTQPVLYQYIVIKASSHGPCWPGTPISPWVHIRRIKFGFRNKKKPKILATGFGAKFVKPSKHSETRKVITLAPIIALATVMAVQYHVSYMGCLRGGNTAGKTSRLQARQFIPLSSR